MLAFAFTSLLSLAPLPSSTPVGEITARGSDSTISVVKALGEAYAKATGNTIKIEGGGSGKGAEACVKGEVPLCFLSRELKESETKQGLTSKPYAYDGVAVIVNNANATNDATVDQLRDWFSGTTATWADGKPLVAFNRNADSGTREVFQQVVMKDAKFSDKAVVKHDGVIVSSVAKIASSVAFTSVGELTADVKAIKINGVAPTHENLRNKTYPLARTLNFATKGEPTPEVKAFIEWVLSKDGQAVVEKAGYTSIVAPDPTPGTPRG